MAGRSFTAGAGLGVLAGAQLPLRLSAAFSPQRVDLIRLALRGLCAGAPMDGPLSSATKGNWINGCDGASAMACMGSGSGGAMKILRPLVAAINPNTVKARTIPTLRHNLGLEPM